jgi:hypothetical protein
MQAEKNLRRVVPRVSKSLTDGNEGKTLFGFSA